MLSTKQRQRESLNKRAIAFSCFQDARKRSHFGLWNADELPHQKLVVIDGLMAFKGSANLTQTAWRKAEIGYDEIEVVTNVEKVIDLHNRYFSPVWANLSEYGDTITIGDSRIDGSAA